MPVKVNLFETLAIRLSIVAVQTGFFNVFQAFAFQHSLNVFNMRKFLPAEEKAKLDQLELIYKTKLEIDAHFTLQKPLRWWLYLHLPISIVLIVLVAMHLYAVLYY